MVKIERLLVLVVLLLILAFAYAVAQSVSHAPAPDWRLYAAQERRIMDAAQVTELGSL